MSSVELSIGERDGHAVIALDGELDLADAADVAAFRPAARGTAKSVPATVVPFPGCGDDR